MKVITLTGNATKDVEIRYRTNERQLKLQQSQQEEILKFLPFDRLNGKQQMGEFSPK